MYLANTLEAITRAISWTLLHSLWIGLIAAFLAGITILVTKKSPASRRYNILTGILFLFTGFMTMVAINEFISVFSNENSANLFSALAGVQTTGTAAGQHETFSFVNGAIDFFNRNASLLLVIWFLIFLVKLMRLIYSIAGLKRLRTESLLNAPEEWIEKLELLRRRLNIRKQVQLFESCLVRIPVTLGCLRPIILFPVGALTSLPPAQLEAVLLHELAHIRRNDYFINIIQLLLESIFFFNPCVLWISSLIRKEREHCCDDLAISKMESRKDFVTALLSFQDFAFGEIKVAQSFMASKSLLVDRARRIVNDHNSTLNKIERKFLVFAIGLLIMLFLGSRFNHSNIGISSLISRFQPGNLFNENDQVTQPGQDKENQFKQNTSLPPVNDGKDFKGLSQQAANQTNNSVKESEKPRDTEIVKTFVPVITERTLVKLGNSIVIDSFPKPYTKPVFSRSNPTIASIISDLKKEGLIKDEGEKFAFILSNEKLCVNGVTQPEAVHQKIFSKYVPDPRLEHINIYYTCCN